MSEETASRPKLVQEGRPLNQPSSLSLAGGHSNKPKYRLVVGGEDENEPLPDDPDQHHSSNYYRGGGGGGRGYYHNRGYHRGGGRRYNRGYRNYGGYRGGTRRRIIKNPKAPGLIDSRIVIGGGDDTEASQEYPDQNIDEEKHHHRIQSTVDVEHIIPQTYNIDLHCLESMEGTVKLEDKTPLIIMDGANVAHAFADIATGKTRGEPDYYGLVVAANYFLAAGKRVLIVLPAPWFRVKSGQAEKSDDGKVDEEAERKAMLANDKIEILKDLKDQGLLVASPPREDDDSFPVTISNKERLRAAEAGEGGSYVLSNDHFRHATGRDVEIDQWLNHEWGRISFAFCDLGTKDEDGNRELDFIPNPRHPMVAEIERHRHAG